MRKIISGLFVVLVGILAALTPVFAQDIIPPSPPFTEAPPIGADLSGAQILLIIEPDGSLGMAVDPSEGPFDGSDDTLYGVTNASSLTIYSIRLQAPNTIDNPIFGFDGDGLCTYYNSPVDCPFGPTGYEGPGVSYASISSDLTTGNVNFANGIPPGGTAYFSLEAAIQTSVCPPISGITPLQQCKRTATYGGLPNPSVALYCGDGVLEQPPGAPLSPPKPPYPDAAGCEPGTIAYFGCQLTAYTMLINTIGAANNSSWLPIIPETLNSYLQGQPDGFDQGTLILGKAVERFALSKNVPLYWNGPANPADFTVNNYLCAGIPVVLGVHRSGQKSLNTHFVLATGQTTVGTTTTYSIIDPDNCSGSIANDTTLQGYNFSYDSMRLFTTVPHTLTDVVIIRHSPVQVVLIDPQGNQTGYNPVTGSNSFNIPGSCYLTEAISADGDDSLSLPEVGILEAPAAVDGNYSLQVFGTNTGPYSVDILGYDNDGIPSMQTVSGMVINGSTAGYQLKYSTSSGSVLPPPELTAVSITQTYPQGTNTYHGSQVQLSLAGSSSNTASYRWFQNGQPLTDGGVVSGSATPVLTIASVTNTAQYYAVISNSSGSKVTSEFYTNDVSAPSAVNFVAQSYSGLFYPPQGGISLTNSGALTLTLTKNGKFTASARYATGTESFSGQMSTTGHAHATKLLKTKGPTLALDLQMDMTPGLARFAGSLTDGSYNASVDLFLEGKSPLTPIKGSTNFTLAFTNQTSATNVPPGYGAFTATMNDAGTLTLSGKLADGTALSQSMLLPTNGMCPLFSSLYGDKGFLLGWLEFTNDTPSADSILWVKPGGLSGQVYYKAGFTNLESMIGSVYNKPTGTNDALVLLNGGGALALAEGTLTNALSNSVVLVKNKLEVVSNNVVVTNVNKIAVTLNPATGTFSGSFVTPVTKKTEKTLSLEGVVLQQQAEALGWFLGTNQAGSVVLQSNP